MTNPTHHSVTPTEILDYYQDQDKDLNSPSCPPSPQPTLLFSFSAPIRSNTVPATPLARGISRHYAYQPQSNNTPRILQTATRRDKRWQGHWLRQGTTRFDRKEFLKEEKQRNKEDKSQRSRIVRRASEMESVDEENEDGHEHEQGDGDRDGVYSHTNRHADADDDQVETEDEGDRESLAGNETLTKKKSSSVKKEKGMGMTKGKLKGWF